MRFAIFLLPALACAAAPGWVAVPAGSFRSANATVRVDAFDMLDHAVTNAEYAEFVRATRYPAPPHWTAGQPAPAAANLPVVFVNHEDAMRYTEWLSARDHRRIRLPTPAEFEWAALGGFDNALYPWTGEPAETKANYDPTGASRTLAEWRKYLKPVKSYPPNGYGLYDMAGNVWNMLAYDLDRETHTYIYRFEQPWDKQGAIMGGSWARPAQSMRCGYRGSASPGIRHPDIGFRPVREPLGATHFARRPRRLVAAKTEGGVYLGWQMLSGAETGFHVYRSLRRDAAGFRLDTEPVRATTGFLDRNPPPVDRPFYRVRAIDSQGREGPPSEWAAPREPGPIATFEPTSRKGPVTVAFGDLDGDGLLDAILKVSNGATETSRDPGLPVELEAFTSYGRSLWRRPLAAHDKCYGSASNLPVVIYDLDGDGKAEIIARLQDGDAMFLAVLDGMTGRVLRKTPWRAMATDFAGSSTRIHMAVAYLDGKHPSIVTQTGLYENEIFDAYDAQLRPLWTFRSFLETNGSGSHHIEVADIDGDGRDDIFDGTTAIGSDGKLRWSIYREHPDTVSVKKLIPSLPGRQVFFGVETAMHAGAYVADAATGKIIWKLNHEDDSRWTHAHVGWAADIWEGSPGVEVMTNRDGHEAKDRVLFSATGKILLDPMPGNWRPVNWTGGAARDLMSADGRELARFDGRAIVPLSVPAPNLARDGTCNMTADLAGDYRDEVVCLGTAADGGPIVRVFSNPAPAPGREITRTASHEYRLWLARNMTGGYATYFEWQPDPLPHADQERVKVTAGRYLNVFRSQPLTRPDPRIERAFILVHGVLRNGDLYYQTALDATRDAGKLERTLVIAPRFKANDGRSCKDVIEDGELAFSCGGWIDGMPALDAAADSYLAMDSILQLAGDKTRFPNLTEIVVAGHSAGGQYLQRYAAANRIEPKLKTPVRYIVANPSSYLYFDSWRPEQAVKSACANFDRYKYGMNRLAGYTAATGAEAIKSQYPKRRVTYLLGENDNIDAHSMDKSCPAMAQGPNRLARGLAYFDYITKNYHATHELVRVPGCDHNAECMYRSAPGVAAVFGPVAGR